MPKESGYIVGNLTIKCSYKVLGDEDISKYPEYIMFINIIKNAHNSSTIIHSENAEIQQAAKRIKYAEHTKSTQQQTTLADQSQPILENGLDASNRGVLKEISSSASNTLLNSLAEAQPYNTYQIIAQVGLFIILHKNS